MSLEHFIIICFRRSYPAVAFCFSEIPKNIFIVLNLKCRDITFNFKLNFLKNVKMFQFFGIEHVKSKNARTHTERESLVKERFIPYKVMFNWSRTFRDGLSLRVSVADEISTKKKVKFKHFDASRAVQFE